jgi:tetratricopeptide (TPR) repeat protein
MRLRISVQDLDAPDLSANERAQLRCNLARQQEWAGDFEAAQEILGDFWQGVAVRSGLEQLDSETKAEVLLRIGTLTGWIGSIKQIAGSQEAAKDLLNEALRTFEQLELRSKAAEARSGLALCYWRIGAYDEARITLKAALPDFDESDLEQRAIALYRRALIEASSKKLTEALRFYNEAAPLFDKVESHSLSGHFHDGLANVLNRLSASEDHKDYLDRALIEYAAASFHFEQAGHERYQACVENNLGFLFSTIGEFEKAHEHLDRAQMIMTRLKDNVHLAQVDDTRARVLLAEDRLVEADKIARAAVRRLEKGDELSILAEALTTHGTALAGLGHSELARASFERAIDVAEQAGDLESAGVAALTLIEKLRGELSNEELRTTLDHATTLVDKSDDIGTVRRLAKSAFQILFSTPLDWEGFSFRRAVNQYEARLIRLALKESSGSVSKASRLLGFKHHQSLVSMLKTRHPELASERSPIKKRRHHIIDHSTRQK